MFVGKWSMCTCAVTKLPIKTLYYSVLIFTMYYSNSYTSGATSALAAIM